METGGIDTAHVSLWVEWTEKTGDISPLLYQAQDIAKTIDTAEDTGELPAVNIGGWCCQVLPFGHKRNKKAAGAFGYYPICFKTADILFALSERDVTDLTRNPNMCVELGSLGLMHNGLQGQMETVGEILEGLGARVLKDAIARIDACVDLPGVHVSALQKAVFSGHVVSKCKVRDQHGVYDTNECGEIVLSAHKRGKHDTGLTLGRGDIVCRMYDKLDEIRVKQAQSKYDVLCEKRWGGCPESATRVEFQLRRNALREMVIPDSEGQQWGIVSVADWLKYEHQICMYLCKTWLRVYSQEFDPRHTERLSFDDMHPDWQKVVFAFDRWTNPDKQDPPSGEVRRQEKPLRAAAASLMRNAMGCIRSALAKCGIAINTASNDWAQKFSYHAWQMIQHQVSEDGRGTFEKRQARTFLRMHVCGEYDSPTGIGLYAMSH